MHTALQEGGALWRKVHTVAFRRSQMSLHPFTDATSGKHLANFTAVPSHQVCGGKRQSKPHAHIQSDLHLIPNAELA